MHGESILTVAKMLDVAIISPPCKENIAQIMLTDKNQHNQSHLTSGAKSFLPLHTPYHASS